MTNDKEKKSSFLLLRTRQTIRWTSEQNTDVVSFAKLLGVSPHAVSAG